MRLVVAEKPSVARDLAKVLGVRARGEGCLRGDDLVITWCVGHLVELEEPAHYDEAWKRWRLDALPMLPERFELRARKGARDQWRVVRALLRDGRFDDVVNACDAGREGELIFRYAYDLAGSTLPVLRLWLSSLTDVAIRKGWSALRPGARLDALGDAARCRSEADWLVGLNATRALTCLARRAGPTEVLSIGRVQTPTLAMIVARDREIEAFVPETFWRVTGTFAVEREGRPEWSAGWFQDRGEAERKEDEDAPRAERLLDQTHAEAVAAAARGRPGTVEHAERKDVRQPPPLLYDLTALQRRANQRYGFDAARTLDLAQALYEKHKLISYPRTDARFLTPDQVPELPEIVEGVGKVPVYAPFAQAILKAPIQPGKRVVDASEVGDHHAIIPTGRVPSSQRLSAGEKRVFDLVARRFLAALSPDAVLAKTALVVAVDPGDAPLPEGITAPLCFRARGRAVIEEGWRAVDPPPRRKDTLLPRVEAGETATAEEVEVVEGRTRPPRPHNDASLLKAMETAGKDLDDAQLKRAMRSAGLGTPATRAAILQTLKHRGYIERKGRELRATERGCAVIDALPVEELKSPELTGRWEARLSAVADGKEARAAFMADVAAYTGTVVEAIAAAEPPPVAVVQPEPSEVLGECPVCGKPVTEQRAVYTCVTGRACAFVVFKKMSGRTISARMVKALLRDGRTKAVKGFRSKKKGKAFSAGLLLREDGSVGFWFPDREGSERSSGSAPPASPPTPATPVGQPCPRCGQGHLIAGRTAWGCDRWREGCRFTLPFEHEGRRLTERQAAERLAALRDH